VRTITPVERRARLALRHHLHPAAPATSPEEAARDLVGLHATDPATVYLSVHARVPGFEPAHLDTALYADRSLVKHLAMRRTLWVVDRGLLAAVQAGASARVAEAERRRLVRDVEKAGLHADGAAWLQRAEAAVLDELADGHEATSTQLREALPLLRGTMTGGVGTRWQTEVPVGPRVLTVLSAGGAVVRATNQGAWTGSRPRWALMKAWLGIDLGTDLDCPEPDEARATLVRAWLARFGPGTLADLTWWFGATKTATRAALRDVRAVEVDLEGETGYVLPEDEDPVGPVEPWAALLPGLDPTTMGWTEREWYLGPHQQQLFDRAGNAGPTAWWDGRIVGGWTQSPAGEVALHLLEPVPRDAKLALEAEAARLGDWLAGTRIRFRFPSPVSRRGS
jgi:hypothetical protein